VPAFELREKYGYHVPKLIENLLILTESKSEMVRLAANRELLDRLVGKPMQVADVNVTRLDVGAMYLAALKRANGNAAQVVEGKTENKPDNLMTD
jgi:hypothetical protein